MRDRRHGWLMSLAPLLAVLGVFTPLAALAYPAVPLTTLAVSAVLVLRRRFEHAVEFSVWCWLLAALARRVVELRLGYQSQNLVLLSPVTAALPLFAALLFVRRPVPRAVAQGLGAVLSAVTLGAVLAVTQLAPLSIVAGVAAWVPPLVLGLATLMLPADRVILLRVFHRIGVVGCLVVGGYGVLQWLVVPVWDRVWLESVFSVAQSFGQPVPFEIRVFSTLNSAGPAASALLFLVVLASLAPVRAPVKVLAVALGLSALGLTEVRQVYVAGLVFLLVALTRRVYPVATVAIVAALLTASVVAVPAARETVGERVVASVRAGGQDESLNARLSFQGAQFGSELARPLGLGLGSTGTGARAAGSSEFANADSGYLEIVRTFGLPLGALFLTGVLLLLAVARRAARDRLAAALFCVSATVPLQLLLGNLFTGPTGAVTWVALFLAVRLAASEPRVPTPPHDVPTPVRAGADPARGHEAADRPVAGP